MKKLFFLILLFPFVVNAQTRTDSTIVVNNFGDTIRYITVYRITTYTAGDSLIGRNDASKRRTIVSPLDLPVSTATQTALDGKQATLVSATNIKPINGSSILGSGDLVVSGGGGDWVYVKLVSAAITTGTGNSNTLLAFTPVANTMYEFEAKLFLQSAATTTGARPGIAWPSGLSQNSAWVISPTSQTAFVSRFFGNTTTANAASTAVAIANEGFYGKVEGMFVTGSSPSGNLTITLASEIAGSEARIMENSFIRYRVIN